MKNLLSGTIGVAAMLFTTSTAFAQSSEAPRGFYLGASLTKAKFDDSAFDFDDIDDEDNSWKATMGVRFNETFAVEANYIDFGESSAPGSGSGDP
jgi:OOP family OmpA-OmpF porin